MSVNEARKANVKTVQTKINRSQTALRHNRSESHRRRDAIHDAGKARKISGIRTDPNEKYTLLEKTDSDKSYRAEELRQQPDKENASVLSRESKNRRTQKEVSNTSVWQSMMDTSVSPIDSRLEDKKKKQKQMAQASQGSYGDKGSGVTSGHHVQKQAGQGRQSTSSASQTASSGGSVAGTAAREGAKDGAKEATGGAATGGVSTAVDLAKRTLRKTREELEAPIMQADVDNGAAGNPDITKSSDGHRSKIVVTMMSLMAAMVQLMMPVIMVILIPTVVIAVLVGIFTSVLTPVVQMAEAVDSIVTDHDDILEALDDETAKIILEEAFKYEGKPYLFGGSNPNTGVDCSGFTKWCYEKVGITLPHSAQGQYDMTQHISMEDAKPGDLVFFKGTYKTNNFITHVEIYVGDGKSFGAGDPIGYHDLSSRWHTAHYVCCGRIGGDSNDTEKQ